MASIKATLIMKTIPEVSSIVSVQVRNNWINLKMKLSTSITKRSVDSKRPIGSKNNVDLVLPESTETFFHFYIWNNQVDV